MALRILFIGGNGTISAASSRLAVARGHDLTLLNRGTSTTRPAIEGVRHLTGDASEASSVAAAIGDLEFDVVVNFRSFLPDQIRADVDLFRGRTGQYVYISSASAYQKPVARLPITESTPLSNPFWQYSRDKAASEDVLVAAMRDHGFPATIVRPSHTYDETSIPLDGGWTIIDRMRRGAPTLVHGDGTSLWTLTHSEDFAKGFVGLLGNPHALGHAVHITSDELLNWNQIHEIVGRALGVTPQIVHIPSDFIARVSPNLGPGLLGDKSWSVIFDNSKIRRLVPGYQATIPFHRGIDKVLAWFDEDETRKAVDPAAHAEADAILAAYAAATR
jgi:nucleoside-diphosphate-sugar epimerase